MTIIRADEQLLSHRARKRLGVPYLYGICDFGRAHFGDQGIFTGEAFFGEIGFGDTYFAAKYWWSGIYRVNRNVNGYLPERMFYYYPTNPNTIPQQTRRTKFQNAIWAWQALTYTAKQVYNAKAIRKNYSGYNLFIKQFMLS
jgi:hypothetical protein